MQGLSYLGTLQQGNQEVGQPEAAGAGGLVGDVQGQQGVRAGVPPARGQAQVPPNQRLHAAAHRARAVQPLQQLHAPR